MSRLPGTYTRHNTRSEPSTSDDRIRASSGDTVAGERGLGRLLRGVPFLDALDEPLRVEIINASVPCQYMAGQVIYAQGTPSETLFVVLTGAVVTILTTAEEDMCMCLVLAPNLLGVECLSDDAARHTSARAVADTHCLVLKRSTLLAMARTRPDLVNLALRLLVLEVECRIEANADDVRLDLNGRVAKVLFQLSQHTSGHVVHGIPQTLIAELAHGSRQGTNHALHQFAERGWVRSTHRTIEVLDLNALRHRAGMRY